MTLVSGDQITEANAGELEAGDWLLQDDGLAWRATEFDLREMPYDGSIAFLGRPDADGWIAWGGGENPVPGVMVECKLRDGTVTGPIPSKGDWLHSPRRNCGYDIIAYRPAPSAVAAPSAAGEVERIAREAIDFISDLDNALTEDRVVAGAAKKVSVRLRSRLLAALSPSAAACECEAEIERAVELVSRRLIAEREALRAENGKLRAAISWLGPQFIDAETPLVEIRKRIGFMHADAAQALHAGEAK